MALDREAVAVVRLQPLGLLLERAARLRRELGRIRLEEHPVADIDDKILLASWRAGRSHAGLVLRRTARASGKRQACQQRHNEPRIPQHPGHPGHSGDSLVNPARTISRSSRASLSEGSVNLDGALRRLRKVSETAETFGNG